jgi:hypothetical protein
MLKFNEGKACDAIIRRLEQRENRVRAGLRSPEQEGHRFPVEIAVTLGNQLFALEHTGIEPFKGHGRARAGIGPRSEAFTSALRAGLENLNRAISGVSA